MKSKLKTDHRGRQSTRQLMGIDQLTPHGVQTPKGDLVFFLIQPDNLSVLPADSVRARIHALTNLLSGAEEITLRALDSRDSYQLNQKWYLKRAEEERNPAIREMLCLDREHLDEIQHMTASTREFVLVRPLPRESGEKPEALIARMAKELSDYGFRVRVAEEKDVRRLLSVYYQQEVSTEAETKSQGEDA